MKISNLISYSTLVVFLFTQNISLAQKENMLKVSLIAPLMEHVEVSYERLIKPKESIEVKIGIIGVGLIHETSKIGPEDNKKTVRKITNGYFVNAGYRFYNPFGLVNTSKILKGFYLQPDLILGRYIIDKQKPYKKRVVNYQALLGNLGYQGYISNRIIFDIYVGLGFGKDNLPRVGEDAFLYFGEFHRGLYKFNGRVSGAMKTGIKIGYTF